MKAVILDVPQAWLDERHRLDLDRKDEMWEGVLHMVPPASSDHNRLGAHLMAFLLPLRTDLEGFFEPGIFDPTVRTMTSYRVADLAFARPEHVSKRGIEGHAALVVEILSPGDESREKMPFYRRVGVEELLLVDPVSRVFELRRAAGDDWAAIGADDAGWVDLTSCGVQLRTDQGRLRCRAGDEMREL